MVSYSIKKGSVGAVLHKAYSFPDKSQWFPHFIMSFNRELIERIQQYSCEHCNHEISEETAIEYLDALADLYESFIEFAENKK